MDGWPESENSSIEPESTQARFVIKVVVCGDWAVGKTSLVRQFVENKFNHDYKPSIGVNVLVKIMDVGKEKLKLNIFDTGGQERLRPLRKRYYQGADAAILVFDLTRASSAVSIETHWMDELKSVIGTDFERILLGNKLDLETDREVSEYAGQQLAERIRSPFFETSALDGRNVELAFKELAKRLMKKHFSEA